MKSKFKIILALTTLITFILLGCEDDPVKQSTEEFDPPRFNWRTAYIPNVYSGFAGLWAQDTNRIFLINNPGKSLYILAGGISSVNFVGNYGLEDIKGISNNEIYIFGAVFYPSNKLTIIKWNGASFEYFETGIIVNTAEGIKGLAINSNDIWITSTKGICRFDGVNMSRYANEDTLLIPVDIFLSNDNKVQYIAERFIDTSHIQQSLFEFRDTGFVQIHNYIITTYPSRTGIFLREINGYKFGLELNEPLSGSWFMCINNFTVSTFTPYFCLSNKIGAALPTITNNPVGSNLQDFIFLVQASEFGFFEHTRYGVIHWNGSRVSKEIELFSNNFVTYHQDIVFRIDPNNYVIVEGGVGSDFAKLYYGTKK